MVAKVHGTTKEEIARRNRVQRKPKLQLCALAIAAQIVCRAMSDCICISWLKNISEWQYLYLYYCIRERVIMYISIAVNIFTRQEQLHMPSISSGHRDNMTLIKIACIY